MPQICLYCSHVDDGRTGSADAAWTSGVLVEMLIIAIASDMHKGMRASGVPALRNCHCLRLRLADITDHLLHL